MALQATLGFAILWLTEAQWAAVRWWAFVRAETASVNICKFFHLLFFNHHWLRAEVFQIPQHRKALSLPAIFYRPCRSDKGKFVTYW
jgi:hypothetical protein